MKDSKVPAIASFLSPLPAVLALVWYDLSGLWAIVAKNPLLSTALIAVSFASAYLGLRKYRLAGGSPGREIGMALTLPSLAIYGIGSILVSPGLHIIGAVALYASLSVVVGGRGFLVPSSLLALPFAALALPYLVPILFAQTFQLAVIVVMVVASIGIRKHHQTEQSPCPHCEGFERMRSPFCPACGRIIARPGLSLRKGGTAFLILFSVLTVGLSTVSVPVAFLNDSGLSISSVGVNGVQSTTPLPQVATWQVAKSYEGLLGTGFSSYEYYLTRENQNMDTWVIVSMSDPGFSLASAVIPGLEPNGSASVGNLPQVYRWLVGEQQEYGYSSTSTAVVLANGSPVNLFISSYVGESASGFVADKGNFSKSILRAISIRLSESTRYEPYINQFETGGPGDYLGAGLASALIVGIAWFTKSKELTKLRNIENSLGLSAQQFQILSFVASRNSMTGLELLAEFGKRSGSNDWGQFYGQLLRLSNLGLVGTTKLTTNQGPRVRWKALVP